MESIIHGNWNEIVSVVKPKLLLNPEGDLMIRIQVTEAVWDTFCYGYILSNGSLRVKVNRWYRVQDYQRWQRGAGIIPEIGYIEEALTSNEADYFPSFFEKLATENVHMMLEEMPGFVLDGADYVVELFRESELVCKFEWSSQLKTRGPMKQLETLFNGNRNLLPNK